MIGKIAVYIAVLLSFTTALIYFISYKKGENLAKTASMLYTLVVAILGFASIFLLSNILAHNFQYTYIWEYSSRELTDPLLVASFFSGQQGSFLLWCLILGVLGLFLYPVLRKHKYESLAMGFFTLILGFLTIMLIAKSPFELVWETYADQGVTVGFTPENGRGLNPLLQNNWITIHPPILFIGYAAMTVPFVIALAGLIMGDHRRWAKIAMPWTLFAAAILGLGIMLGGFWAYETLGWGGWWGWDPVENSSLIPWLVSIALIHTLLVHKTTSGLVKTNYVLAILGFVLVLYATYLTRSGILSDVSVHSFVAPGFFVHLLLEIYMGVFAVLGLGIFFFKIKEINKTTNQKPLNYFSKEFFLAFGSVIVLAVTVIIFIGTSLPWMSAVIGKTSGAVEPDTYNVWTLPFGVLILLTNAISLYLKWNSNTLGDAGKKMMIPLIFAIVATVISIILGIHNIGFILLMFSGFFSLYANIEYFVKSVSVKPSLTGAYISHFGLSLLLIGAVISGGYSQTKAVQLSSGESKEALGYNFTFSGKERLDIHKQDREKYEYHITIERDGSSSVVKPVVYWSDFNDWQSPFLEPGIKIYATKDVYVSPRSIESNFDVPMVLLAKDQKKPVPVDSSITAELVQFDMAHGMMEVQDNEMVIGALLEFNTGEESYRDTLYCVLNVETWQGVPQFYQIPGTNIEAGFMQLVRNEVDITQTQAVIIFKNVGEEAPSPSEVFTFEATIKPMINLVWLGTIALVAGFFVAMGKHRNERKLISKVNKTAPTPEVVDLPEATEEISDETEEIKGT